jgi:hypothetical protein
MSDMAYAVHTRSCTYLLDDDGVCQEYLDEIDVEELVTFREVTLTIPLYRPEAQAAATLPRRSVIGPGRRLR